MVYELTVQSVKLKSTLFTPPSRLINTCEATCAIGMLYKKAGQPMPQVKAGDNLGKLIESIPQQVYDAEGGNLSEIVRNYTWFDSDEVTEDAAITLRMGTKPYKNWGTERIRSGNARIQFPARPDLH